MILLQINDDETIADAEFLGGCNGNLQGIKSLIKGMKIKDVAEKLKGINCGGKGTSCPDQLAKCLQNTLLQKLILNFKKIPQKKLHQHLSVQLFYYFYLIISNSRNS